MQGKRKDFNLIDTVPEEHTIIPVLECGEYGKDNKGAWWVKVPLAEMSQARLTAHKVVEHEDGTITVSPSILMEQTNADGKMGKVQWHGYLEHGVWREC